VYRAGVETGGEAKARVSSRSAGPIAPGECLSFVLKFSTDASRLAERVSLAFDAPPPNFDSLLSTLPHISSPPA
jgi:hypothetical protein